MCQAGVFGESPGTGAIHERDYDDRTGSSLTIVGLAMTIGQKTDSKSMARKWSTRISILKGTSKNSSRQVAANLTR
jgi:hypothetical protein